MISYIDYSYYKEEYKGKVPCSDFEKLSIQASNYIKVQAINKVNINEITEELKYATCLVLDELYYYEQKRQQVGVKVREQVDTWQVDYQTMEEMNQDKERQLQFIVKNYLSDLPQTI